MTGSDNATFAYLPVSEIVTRLGLYVTGVGTDLVPPGSTYPRQQHPELYDFTWRAGRVLPEYQFVFVVEGKGEFESRETGPLEVSPGTVMMLFPDVWHRYRPAPETGWKEYWISLGGELLFQWHERGLFRSDRPLTNLRRPMETARRYRDVIDFVMQHPDQDAPLLTSHAMAIVADTLEPSQAASGIVTAPAKSKLQPISPMVTEVLRLIWNHSHQRVSVDMLARQVGVTRRTIERHFQQELGRTVLQELLACRIQRAQRLLGETNVPIKYVAYAAGFSSLSNLCKVFRREIGITPGDYREKQVHRVKRNSASKQLAR